MMTSFLLIVMWQVKKEKENLQPKYYNPKKNTKKTSSEWITGVMSQAAKEPQQDGTLQHLLS